jgi:putative endonuclease
MPFSGYVMARSDPAKPGRSRTIRREKAVAASLYILRCADGSYYVGTTIGSRRVAEYQAGTYGGYTSPRRPVALVFHPVLERLSDAAIAERQVKGWRREKKEALIRGDFAALPLLARRGATARSG